jgi:hypothetical protein
LSYRRQLWEEAHQAAERNRQQIAADAAAAAAGVVGTEHKLVNGEQALHETPLPAGAATEVVKVNQKQPYTRQHPTEQPATPSPSSVPPADVGASDSNAASTSSTAGVMGAAAGQPSSAVSPWERRRQRLEADRLQRERELLEFQKQHWLEVKASAQRNRELVSIDAWNHDKYMVKAM